MIKPELRTVDPSDVVVDERLRHEFKREDMDKLITSMTSKGQLQPGVCRIAEDGAVHLIAGERRLRACQALKRPFLYLLEEETSPMTLLEIEFEENVCRANLTFLEEAKALQRFHLFHQMLEGEAKAGEPGGHGVRDTATMLQKSYGNVAEDLELAEFSDLPEIKGAKNKTEAKKIIKRMKEEFLNSEALRRAQQREDSCSQEELLEKALQDPMVLELLEKEEKKDSEPSVSLDRIAYFKKNIRLGSMESILSQEIPDETFDIVVFDPPWGVDLEKVSDTDQEKIYFRDDAELFHSQLQKWLDLLYKKMKPNSHLYMFFGIVNHEFVYKTLKECGFTTNQMPLIWYKQGAHVVRTPDVWPGRSYEPIAFARKGSKSLIKKGAPDVIITPAPSSYLKNLHPTAKHPDIILELLKRSAMPGDHVLDPMCGSGMTGVACEVLRTTHSLTWTEIEELKEFWELSIINVSKGYFKLINVTTLPTVECLPFYICPGCKTSGASELLQLNLANGTKDLCPACGEQIRMRAKLLPPDFKSIDFSTEQGKVDWIDYWKLHPEKQEEMLTWRKEKTNELSGL